MRLRERMYEDAPIGQPGGAGPSGALGEARQRVEAHIAAGMEHIEQNLSGNHEKYLEATRQRDGQ